MSGDMKEHTFHIQTEHKILGSDHGLDHAKILVGGLTLDRGLYAPMRLSLRRSLIAKSTSHGSC
jgi:hypothetical protein